MSIILKEIESDYVDKSDGTGFEAIDVGNFTASLIQAADGQFVCQFQTLRSMHVANFHTFSWSQHLLLE